MIPLRSRKRWILAALAASAFASGMTQAFVPELGDTLFLHVQVAFVVLDVFLLFAWVQFDRRELGVPRSAGFNFALAWFALVAVPVHFARHRPAGRRWQPIVLFLLALTLGYHALLIAGVLCGMIARTLLIG
jgi:hypothetical protein